MKKLLKYFLDLTPKQISIFFTGSTLIYFLAGIFIETSSFSFLFSANLSEFKLWYPHLYWLVFIFVKLISGSSIIIILLQSLLLLFKTKITRIIWLISIGLILCSQYFYPNQPWIVSLLLGIVYLYFINQNQPEPIRSQEKYILSENQLITGLFLLAFIVRIIWMLNTDNCGNGDAGMRLLEVKRWSDLISKIGFDSKLISSPYFIMPSSDWLPLHYYFMGIIGKVTNDWIYSPRILSALFGSLTLIPLYKLTKFKFNQRTAIIATLILTFYGYHVFISSLTLSEPFYIFFIVLAYYLIEKWIITNSNKTLTQLAFVLAALCLLRYEGWFFSFIIVLILPFISKQIQWKNYLFFSFIVFLSTLFVMLLEIWYGFHPLKGILYSDYEVKIALNNSLHSMTTLVNEFKNSYIPLSIISVFILGYTYLKNRNQRAFSMYLLYLFPLLPFIYKLSNGTLTAQARYMTLYMVPLIPFIAFVINKALFNIPKFYVKIVFLIFFIFLMNISLYNQFKTGYPLLKYKTGFHKSVQFVEKINKASIYLDSEEQWGEFNWVVESNISSITATTITRLKLKNLFKKIIVGKVEDHKNEKNIWNYSYFDNLLKKNQIDCIVLFPKGELLNHLKFKNENEMYMGIHFKRVFSYNGYLIYSVIN